MKRPLLLSIALLAVLTSGMIARGQSSEPWSTYRGNAQRTASDDKAGPTSPKVLWALKSKDQFIASPTPMGDRLFIPSLGAFNLGNLSCIATDPAAKSRTLWVKAQPLLKLPAVSSPAIFKGHLIFGDGMHQTNGAFLYCFDAQDGEPVWRHQVPGDLVHLEGSPAIVGNQAYIGGGAAGVLCIEIDKAYSGGKAYDFDALKKQIIPAYLKDLQAKYEIEKKKDPFAQPPTDEAKWCAEPKRLWQEGKEKWHVDAPLAVVGDKVLAASAFLDKEQVGERALICLDAATGKQVWKAPLKLNPWGGPSVAGDTVIVTGGSISMDYNLLKGAKGFVAAFDLAKGELKWIKDITGGVVACAALSGNSAIVTATDGKVRAFDVATGERQWLYDAKMPFFAPAAIAKDVVYAGDLKGVLHAIDLKSGTESWKLELGTHKDIQSPGMIYGGPVVQNGRLYVATCNLQGPNAQKDTVVVCIGEK